MGKCVTGKTIFESKELAEEALIQNYIRNNHRKGSGPINVYECRECTNWHFTSQGEASPLLNDPETVKRIAQEQRARDWEFKLK